jgi:mono/diheme cytochrome c family protein
VGADEDPLSDINRFIKEGTVQVDRVHTRTVTRGRRTALICGVGIAVVAAAGALTAFTQEKGGAPADKPQIARGQYLVTITGCNDCHTPWKPGPQGPEPDMNRMLSGHPEALAMPPVPTLPPGPWMVAASGTLTAWAGPWGTTYTTNLTPDTNTGMGIWTEEMFIKAIRTGKHMGTSRPIMPPMPWPGYAQMTDEDLKAVFAYLRSIPPIHNRVPEYAPPPAEPGKK